MFSFCEIRSLHWPWCSTSWEPLHYGLWSSWCSKQKLHKLVLIWLRTHWLISDSLGSHSDCSRSSSVEAAETSSYTSQSDSRWALVSPDGHTRTHSELQASANAWTQAFKTHTCRHIVCVCVCEGSAGSPNKSNPINLPPPHSNKERAKRDRRGEPPSPPLSQGRGERKNILWISGNLSQFHCFVDVSSYLRERRWRAVCWEQL